MEHIQSLVYSLQGESLEIARSIQEAHQTSREELDEIDRQVAQYRATLIATFEQKHDKVFRTLFDAMATAICVPLEQLKTYHMDLTYVETHGLAFLQEGPITDNVVVLNVDHSLAEYT